MLGTIVALPLALTRLSRRAEAAQPTQPVGTQPTQPVGTPAKSAGRGLGAVLTALAFPLGVAAFALAYIALDQVVGPHEGWLAVGCVFLGLAVAIALALGGARLGRLAAGDSWLIVGLLLLGMTLAAVEFIAGFVLILGVSYGPWLWGLLALVIAAVLIGLARRITRPHARP